MSKIICVVPTIRPKQMDKFLKSWAPLFEKHNVTLLVIQDGDSPCMKRYEPNGVFELTTNILTGLPQDLFYRFTDSCRNIGFVEAAKLNPDYVLTLDDDVEPINCIGQRDDGSIYKGISLRSDPIQAHLDVFSKRVPISWMNTAHMSSEYLRGVPYGVREEAPVMLSHGVWAGTPDFDGETQLRLEKGSEKIPVPPYSPWQNIPYTLPYYVGPVPRGALFPICGMNVVVKREALPYFYFAPMGVDTGLDLHRFGDIWMGIYLKRKFDELGWAIYTGSSTVHHTRASDAKKNMEQEKLGREWNEYIWNNPHISQSGELGRYLTSYFDKRQRYTELISGILNKI